MVESAPWGFVRPFLIHVDSHRSIYSGFVGRESATILERHMQRMLSRLLTEDLARRGLSAPDAVREAVLVGALWGLLMAWVERRFLMRPEPLALEMVRALNALTSG